MPVLTISVHCVAAGSLHASYVHACTKAKTRSGTHCPQSRVLQFIFSEPQLSSTLLSLAERASLNSRKQPNKQLSKTQCNIQWIMLPLPLLTLDHRTTFERGRGGGVVLIPNFLPK